MNTEKAKRIDYLVAVSELLQQQSGSLSTKRKHDQQDTAAGSSDQAAASSSSGAAGTRSGTLPTESRLAAYYRYTARETCLTNQLKVPSYHPLKTNTCKHCYTPLDPSSRVQLPPLNPDKNPTLVMCCPRCSKRRQYKSPDDLEALKAKTAATAKSTSWTKSKKLPQPNQKQKPKT